MCKNTATWQNQVYHTDDSVHEGQQLAGLVGRLYLFDKDIGASLVGDGAVTVDVYDEQVLGADGKGVHLEQWKIDPQGDAAANWWPRIRWARPTRSSCRGKRASRIARS